MGITKIRITGGEPLVRKDILFLCANIAATPGAEEPQPHHQRPARCRSMLAGSLSPASNASISAWIRSNPKSMPPSRGGTAFDQVWAGIRAAQETGFAPIKLNAVVMRGVNDDEIEDLACLTYHYPFEVRFIEFMPFQSEEGDNRFVSADEILERLARRGTAASGREREQQRAGSPLPFSQCPGQDRDHQPHQ